MRGELSNKMSVAFYACLQFLRILALVFSACGHAAADMPLGLIDIKQLAHLMLNCFAAALTVALFSMMYSARSQARSSILVYTCTTPQTHIVNIYDGGAELMQRSNYTKLAVHYCLK